MKTEDTEEHCFPDTNWAAYNIKDLDTCLSDLRTSRQAHNINLVYIIPENFQASNILIIWVSGSSDERAEAVDYFTRLIRDKQLTDNGGLHTYGDSYIVIPDSLHWSDKIRHVQEFADHSE
ncbi:hypothetical protein N7520_007123 [Penicillium odoratum]|uniref:uncharacterized protein n=1 Tax=Penicillium odoratum TaxID=1167516 RepID=UPI0025467707|nr:uncharacterized protein N7520_007123 [Penicillium odoratum]KAJ5759967.1 hypothetical protein N7520_007123 [Penicillium odoratum]